MNGCECEHTGKADLDSYASSSDGEAIYTLNSENINVYNPSVLTSAFLEP